MFALTGDLEIEGLKHWCLPGRVGTRVLRERDRNRHGTEGTVELGVETVS